jgi:hypothetical protein
MYREIAVFFEIITNIECIEKICDRHGVPPRNGIH